MGRSVAKLKLSCKCDFEKLKKKFLKRRGLFYFRSIFDKFGEKGVKALSSATPKRTGLTAASWYYEIIQTENKVSIVWKNSNRKETLVPSKKKPGTMRVNSVPIALVIYYGHGTPTGGYVEGIDYITPAIQPVMEELKDQLIKKLKEVTVE